MSPSAWYWSKLDQSSTSTGLTLVARRTAEVGLLQSMLKPNDLQHELHGDVGTDGHLDPDTRRRLFSGKLRD
jgi:hypothetical protein